MQGHCWILGFLCVVGALTASCAPPGPEVSPGTLPPAQVEIGEKWATALDGLTIADGAIESRRPTRADRQRAVARCEQAEEELTVRNLRVKAAGLYRDAILLDPSLPGPYLGLAQCLMQDRTDDVVEAALRTALRLDEDLHRARFLLGALHQMRGDNRAASDVWCDLVARAPDYPEVYVRLAVSAHFDGDAPLARQYLAEAKRRRQPVPAQLEDLLEKAKAP